MEITINITGLDALAEALNRFASTILAGQSGHVGSDVAPQQPQTAIQGAYTPAPQFTPTQPPQTPQYTPQAPQPQQQPQTPQYAPQNAYQQIPPYQAVPTSAPVQSYTLEQLQVAAGGLSMQGKTQQLYGIMSQFGVQAMTELPKERYGEFAVALRGAGAQI